MFKKTLIAAAALAAFALAVPPRPKPVMAMAMVTVMAITAISGFTHMAVVGCPVW
jgi:hypothetical protein